jgi:hypothetical protein
LEVEQWIERLALQWSRSPCKMKNWTHSNDQDSITVKQRRKWSNRGNCKGYILQK